MSKPVYVPVTYGDSIAQNSKNVGFIHDVSSLAIGTAAGILSLESIYGFAMFVISMFVIDSIICLLLVANGGIGNYFKSPMKEIYLNDYSRSISSFIMMWTLTFCLVGGN